ncbi:MAG: 1-(5-phosphoribosyl)-5-[(5-phosphoribosylamino)methylideneamino]imidazole-4-carboxamide isomerase [Bacteroidales bacterium]|nr:1-(5-phosphoribosyl)-5-[(5-phosphoribosylamino)methylideneamino]imidazole-4-carboxamide isomerase [Bacteroidales bacterium]
MIQIIPAIDIIDGRCVRLTKGDYSLKTVYDGAPEDVALSYADCGVRRIHIVDLDGAKLSCPQNLRSLERIASRVNCEIEWGGGIKDDRALRDVFNAGGTKAIVGSVAALKPELFELWLKRYGKAMILGADIREGKVSVSGWQEDTPLRVEDMVERFAPFGLEEVIVTDISRDGMLQGPSDSLYTALQERYPANSFTVSGGISSMADIERLNALGLRKVIVGKAIYEKKISLKDIEKWSQSA